MTITRELCRRERIVVSAMPSTPPASSRCQELIGVSRVWSKPRLFPLLMTIQRGEPRMSFWCSCEVSVPNQSCGRSSCIQERKAAD